MPANLAAARLTDGWRAWLAELVRAIRRQAAGDLAELDLADVGAASAAWVEGLAPIVLAAADAAGLRATGYLQAYLAASGVAPPVLANPPAVDAGAVRERLDHARVAMLWRLSRGDGRSAARGSALAVMDRNATSAVYEQARTGERAGMESTTEIVGYRRVTSARPCGACLALSSQRRATGEGLDVHDRCSCSAEPIVRAVREQVFRPDGAARVAAMSDEELAATFRGTGGAEKAALVRSRGVEALVAYANGQLVEAPLATIT